MSKQSDIVKVSQDAGTTGFVNTTGDTMTGPLVLGDGRTYFGKDGSGNHHLPQFKAYLLLPLIAPFNPI
mgnify:CR=1 FL=1